MHEHCQRDKGRRPAEEEEEEDDEEEEEEEKKVRNWDKGKFRSGEFRKSLWHFVRDTPITGLFEPGQARKTAGHNTAGKFNRRLIITSAPFVCLSTFKSFLCREMQRKEAGLGLQRSKMLEFNNKCYLFLKGIAFGESVKPLVCRLRWEGCYSSHVCALNRKPPQAAD